MIQIERGIWKKGRSTWKELRVLGSLFFFLIQILHIWGNSKIVLEGLDKIFKSNLCCYIILKIKNLLIKTIHL